MNTKHIHDLTFRLCQALDQNYDVVNMETVLCVISSLEGTTVTKEQLETTRLSKYINHLRRRTKDEHLARRAKSLLKKWREMVGIQQQHHRVIETALSTSSIAMSSVACLNTGIHQQQRPRSQSISPAASSMHFDAIQQHSNSNSYQAIGMSVGSSAISENIPRRMNVTPVPLTSMQTGSTNVNIHTSNKRLGEIEVQNEVTEKELTLPPGISRHANKQPTSFENVLSGFAVSENIGIISDTSTFRQKLNKTMQQRISLPSKTETFVIDQSSNSNSQSLILPSNSRPPTIAPIVIDIQDSNSSSNLVTPVLVKAPKSNKMASTNPDRPQSANWVRDSSTAVAPSPSSKFKKLKKEKKRRDRGECNIQSGADNTDGRRSSILLDETSSNLQSHHHSNENIGNEDKSCIAYPEILSLLDNSSLSSMFPPECSTNPGDEQNKVNLSTSNSSRTTFNLSTSDLTFAGKFKQGNALPSANFSNDLIGYHSQHRNASPKSSFQTGATPSKFISFLDVGSNSNDSNSNSQASQMDLIDVVSNDKALHAFQAQRKQDNSNSQQKTAGTVNISPTPTVPASVFFPKKKPCPTLMELTILSAANAPVFLEKVVPRKRGRKKGSKGVDSVIAKETSLTSQMLMTSLSSGSKKVKTTKELYAEMQNRKMGITATSSSPNAWPVPHQQQTSRPTSSCSEPSLQSPHTFDACSTNATVSTMATRYTPENFQIHPHADGGETTSDTITSEPSRDSSAIPKNLKLSLSIDSNSNSQITSSAKAGTHPSSASGIQSSDTVKQIAVIERQLLEILKKVPPEPNIADIELNCTAELIPCTCKVTEIPPENKLLQESAESKETDIETVKDILAEQNSVQNSCVAEKTFEEPIEATSGNTVYPNQTVINQISPATPSLNLIRPKPKKSIFDLDFEDDEDPLHAFIAEAAAASLKKENLEDVQIQKQLEPHQNVAIPYQVEQPQPFDYKMDQSIAQAITGDTSIPIFPTYEVNEDPQCVAKQRFDIQTQKITKFHIGALHNCFIANVNGNWDNANSTIAFNRTLEEVALSAETGCVITDGCNVVPKYGSLVKERIRKDLSHISFSKNYNTKKKATATNDLYKIPFMGVARSVLTNTKKRKSHNHKSCHKLKVPALKNFMYDNVNDVGQQIMANARTEEYKTDEQSIFINVIKDNLTPERCNRTSDAEIITSSLFADISAQSVNTGADISTVKPFDLTTCAIVGKNNNNVTLKDITIDVVSHGNDLFLPNSNELNDNAENGQNLLVIADHLDYSTKSANTFSGIPTTSSTLGNAAIESYTLESQKIFDEQKQYSNDSGSVDVSISDTSCKSVKNVCLNKSLRNVTNEYDDTAANENISSRCSSSSSNSSLKQTQYSINLKLRRQFQDQKLLDVKEEGTRRRKMLSRIYPTDKKNSDNAVQEIKQPRIKRIKIAIKGEMATQMQITCGSSYNSTDEDNEGEPADSCTFNYENEDDGVEGIIADEEQEHPITASVSSEDVESKNSTGTVSTCNQVNMAGADDEELNANSAENNYNDDEELEYDDYGDLYADADAEFDESKDGEDYSGDYHEVVTRDISVPSAGNNHIVLTIKKTPSKNNSPSNSLSAMSPVIANNNTNGSQTSGTVISPIDSNMDLHTASSVSDIDMNALIVKKLEIEDCSNTVSSISALETITLISSAEETQSQSISHVQFEIKKPSDIKNVEMSSPKRFFNFDDRESLASVSQLHFAPLSAKHWHKDCREQRRRHNIKNTEKRATECAEDIKLHRELFFSHELVFSDNDGIKHSILNISSCSSSCAEDSEYDDYKESLTSSTYSASKEICHLSMHSDGGFIFEANGFEFCEANNDSNFLQQRKRSPSTSSCSTYTSSCDRSNEADLQTKGDNKDGDCVLNESVDKRGSESGDVISVSSPTLTIPFSNEKKSLMLANATNDIELSVNEYLPLENNGLLNSFNNIYYTVDTLEAQTSVRTMNNANSIENGDCHLMRESVVVDPAVVDPEKQQEYKLQNKNCDDYNNLYNKNSNINLIRYYINEPCLESDVYHNKQSGSFSEVDQQREINNFNTGDENNATTDVYVINDDGEQIIFDDANEKNNIDLGSTHSEQGMNGRADPCFNFSGENNANQNTKFLPVQSSYAEVMLPHQEYQTGLRAVDEDVDDDNGNNCARIQRFKEWHEVLQLRSYNDELLTVLPYVVLD